MKVLKIGDKVRVLRRSAGSEANPSTIEVIRGFIPSLRDKTGRTITREEMLPELWILLSHNYTQLRDLEIMYPELPTNIKII